MGVIIQILDLAGTAAFAVTGVLTGINKRLDLFGLFMLAVLTASGGGLIRDVILHDDIPVFFKNPKYLLTILLVLLISCIALHSVRKLGRGLQIFDAIGLAVFTITAAVRASQLEYPLIGILFVSVITGTGGGILRDIIVNDVPLLFRREIYAVAAIAGALLFLFLEARIRLLPAVYISIIFIVALRMVSIFFNINLPVIRAKNEKMKL